MNEMFIYNIIYDSGNGVCLKVANFNFPKVDFASQVGEMSGCIAGIPVMPADISPAWLAKCRAHWFSE